MQVKNVQTGSGDINLTQQNNFILPPTPPDLTRQLNLYLQTMIVNLNNLALSPLDPAGQESAHLTLDQVYVNLNVETSRPVMFQDQQAQTQAVLATAANRERLVILGDPGSGKSTFLSVLGLYLVRARLEPDQAWLDRLKWPLYPAARQKQEMALSPDKDAEPVGHAMWPHLPYVPILVTLRDFAATDFDPASPLALWQFIQDWLVEKGLQDSIPALHATLCAGEAILLLDGVDEVPPADRPQVWQAIGALSKGVFNRCRWLTTCRKLSFDEQEAATAGALENVTLAPLNPTQIKQFVQHWYQALIKKGWSQTKGESYQTQLIRAATGNLRPLAQNPMLLTIMALVQTYHGTLPDERVKLYQACVDTLLLRWQMHKEDETNQLPASLAALAVKLDDIEPLLWEIAYTAHQEKADQAGAADISRPQIMKLAAKHLGSYAKAEVFVEYTEQRAHLLLGRGGKDDDLQYSFPHRTFQEYLAGRYLANQYDFGLQAAPLAEKDSWREALLLAAGDLVYNNKTAGTHILLRELRDILPDSQPQPGDTPAWQRVWRTAEMLAVLGRDKASNHPLGQKILPRLRTDLAALLTHGQLTPPERAAAGQTLALLGDPRPGVGLVSDTSFSGETPEDGAKIPHILWQPIPSGQFIMGDDQGDEDYGEKPAHPVTLPAFEISRYPITNEQFNVFVSAGGYQQAQYWRTAKKAGYWQTEGFKGDWDSEFRIKPVWFEYPYHLPNHPVVGVSWYEAVAFCYWLTKQSKIQNPKSKIVIRLPTEAEWERAARGTDGRKFPWGDEDEAAVRCNMSETGITITSPVGMFPVGRSPDDVFDMSGNVWEWCSTVWDKKAYPFKVKNEWDDKYLNRTNVSRVLRGGAFLRTTYGVRCASRLWDHPYNWNYYFGFRVVRPPSGVSGNLKNLKSG